MLSLGPPQRGFLLLGGSEGYVGRVCRKGVSRVCRKGTSEGYVGVVFQGNVGRVCQKGMSERLSAGYVGNGLRL